MRTNTPRFHPNGRGWPDGRSPTSPERALSPDREHAHHARNPRPYLRGVEIVSLGPRLHLIRPVFGQAYLWRDDDGITLVDTGIPGSEAAFAAAFDELGLRRADLRRIVITHGHEDHVGSAAALRAWGGDVTVYAHRADAPIVRGLRPPRRAPAHPGRAADLRAVTADMPPCRPARSTSSSATATPSTSAAAPASSPPRATPTAASRWRSPTTACCSPAISSPTARGAHARAVQHQPRPGPLSFAALAQVPAATVCFGHGDPLSGPDGAAAWRRLGERCAAGPERCPTRSADAGTARPIPSALKRAPASSAACSASPKASCGAPPPPPTRSRAPWPRTAARPRSGTRSPTRPAGSTAATPATWRWTTTTASARTSRSWPTWG